MDATTIHTLFESVPKISSLDLSNRNIGDYAVEQLVLRFEHLPLLKELDLSDNAFGASGCETLGKYLRNVPSLQKLHLGVCDMKLLFYFVKLPVKLILKYAVSRVKLWIFAMRYAVMQKRRRINIRP